MGSVWDQFMWQACGVNGLKKAGKPLEKFTLNAPFFTPGYVLRFLCYDL